MAQVEEQPDTRTWLRPSDAARVLGVTPLRVRQLCAAGELRHEWTPLGRLIDPESVAARAAERKAR